MKPIYDLSQLDIVDYISQFLHYCFGKKFFKEKEEMDAFAASRRTEGQDGHGWSGSCVFSKFI